MKTEAAQRETQAAAPVVAPRSAPAVRGRLAAISVLAGITVVAVAVLPVPTDARGIAAVGVLVLVFGGVASVTPSDRQRLATVTTRFAASKKAARESHDRFRSLVQHAPDLITLVDSDGLIRYDSPALASVLGYNPRCRVGLDAAQCVHPGDRDEFAASLAAVVADPPRARTIEIRIGHRDGAWRWMEVLLTNLLAEPGVKAVVMHARDVTDRRAAREELAALAFRDPVTGLANRAEFMQRLEATVARRCSDRAVSLLFLDLDSFKVVNDSLGHEMGDELLVAVAARLQECLPGDGLLARLGGDEFTVLLDGVALTGARTVASTVLRALEEPFAVGAYRLRAGASIGIAMLGEETSSASELVRHADLAMYEAKQRGKGRAEIFHPRLAQSADRRLVMEGELRAGLEAGELLVHYQPEICLTTSAVASREALVRWCHPVRGVLFADEFVPLAEETGLVHAVGRYAVEQACRDAAAWLRAGDDASVSVNLGERQLRDGDVVPQLQTILEASGLSPSRLTIEVPERALTTSRQLLDTLREIRGLGVRLSLDDFGTASSSFSHLKHLPFQLLKLDRSLLAGLGETSSDEAIVAAAISVAHALGMVVTAEGVETPVQLDILGRLGCDRAQGRLLCAPGTLSLRDAPTVASALGTGR